MKDALREHEKALENEEENRARREHLRAARQRALDRERLAHACGVKDEKLLDRLMGAGVDGASLPALVLVPLVTVAWADRDMALAEQRVILGAAAEFGIEPGSSPHELLDSWLQERPPTRLFAAWRAYIQILCRALDPVDRDYFAALILRQARQVSEAAGGLLGVSARSGAERAVLERLEDALEVDIEAPVVAGRAEERPDEGASGGGPA